MLIKIGRFDCTECWDGVFYKNLSNYPNITEWETQTIMDFVEYEAKYGRTCDIEAEEVVLNRIKEYKTIGKNKKRVSVPKKITECTACPKYKGIPAKELKAEKRNAANDPEDYFDYIMFAWGNCQSGDRLVMERKLGRFPNKIDLSIDFTPGVRFFFRYHEIVQHPNTIFEGVLPLKIKDEVVLKNWVYAIIVPTIYQDIVNQHIPENLKEKIHFIQNDCKDIWEWSEKVYEYVKKI